MFVKTILLFVTSLSLLAMSNEELAYRLHVKLMGSPPRTPQMRAQLEQILNNANNLDSGLKEASLYIINNESTFYSDSLKQFLAPLTNTAGTDLVQMNDTIATLIGAVRDSGHDPNRPDFIPKPFNRILYDDMIYAFDASMAPLQVGFTDGTSEFDFILLRTSRYLPHQNYHYIRFEDLYTVPWFFDFHLRLTEFKQSEPFDTEHETVANYSFPQPYEDDFNARATPMVIAGVNGSAGILTTRAWGFEMFNMGTNRRVTRYVFKNFLCKDFEELHDTSLSDKYVARDVPREIGGDFKIYQTNCKGCHAGQDSLRGAMAYYDFEVRAGEFSRMTFTPGEVVEKMNRNSENFLSGWNTKDDSWENFWAHGQNSNLGWRGPTTGNGLKAWGEMFAKSRAFASCMTKKTFTYFCHYEPGPEEEAFLEIMADEFEANDEYDFKNLISNISIHCLKERYGL